MRTEDVDPQHEPDPNQVSLFCDCDIPSPILTDDIPPECATCRREVVA